MEKLKSFKELRELDLSEFLQKKPTFYKNKEGKMVKTTEDKWLDYIEWAVVLDLLYKNGAKSVSFLSEMHPSFTNTLLISLSIDGVEFKTSYPIINGNSIISNPNQMDIHKAELRGFVKAVAIHTGLGLGLWMKEEKITSEYLTESHTIKVNVKQLMENAESESELINIWKSISEDEQVKYKDIFTDRKSKLKG